MEINQEWEADGRVIQAIEPFFQEKRCEPYTVIGMMISATLAAEVVGSHNKSRLEILQRTNGD